MEFLIFLSMTGAGMMAGLLPAYIAKSKGHDFNKWWIYGTLLFIVALPHSILTKQHDYTTQENSPNGQKKCPFCAEFVKSEATLCRFCQNEFPKEKPLERSGNAHRVFSSERWQCGVCDEVNDSNAKSCSGCGSAL